MRLQAAAAAVDCLFLRCESASALLFSNGMRKWIYDPGLFVNDGAYG